MGILKRLKNIIVGKTNKALDAVENPMEQLDLSIRKKQEALETAKRESAAFIGSIPVSEKKIEALELKKAEYLKGAKVSKDKGNIDTAKKFLIKKNEVEVEIQSIKTAKDSAEKNAELIKNKISKLEKEIENMKVKKTELKARYSTAKAAAKVNELLADLNDDTNMSISEIESKIEEKESYANGIDSFRDTTEDELNSILNSKTDEELINELDKL